MVDITVGITTRNRPEALRRCLESVARFVPSAEVIVFDDGSAIPANEQIAAAIAPRIRVLRDHAAPGYIAGRNAIASAAQHELLLLLDDDAVLLDGQAIAMAASVLERDRTVGAVALAQAEADGRPWPEAMQAGRGTSPAYVPCFIGFAHLVRRSVFLRLGGYRTEFVFYGEEKDFCLRLLDAGYRTVYLPAARVAHLVDANGRDRRRYVRYAIRNDCLASLYNEPWPLALASLAVRVWRYRRMAAGIPGGDRGGLSWLVGEVRHALPRVLARRRPVHWNTVRQWRRLRRNPVPYCG